MTNTGGVCGGTGGRPATRRLWRRAVREGGISEQGPAPLLRTLLRIAFHVFFNYIALSHACKLVP